MRIPARLSNAKKKQSGLFIEWRKQGGCSLPVSYASHGKKNQNPTGVRKGRDTKKIRA